MDASRRALELGVALISASDRNMIIEICRLLTQGGYVNYVARQIHEGVEISTTPLIQAALKGHADAVRVLTSRGAEVNKPEPCLGQTPLHAAAQGNLVPVIEPRHDVMNIHGHTPLLLAAFKGHKEAAIYLLDHVGGIHSSLQCCSRRPPLHYRSPCPP
jgi:ankyrin repeat protein